MCFVSSRVLGDPWNVTIRNDILQYKAAVFFLSVFREFNHKIAQQLNINTVYVIYGAVHDSNTIYGAVHQYYAF